MERKIWASKDVVNLSNLWTGQYQTSKEAKIAALMTNGFAKMIPGIGVELSEEGQRELAYIKTKSPATFKKIPDPNV